MTLSSSTLYAAIDMGTNSFKMIIIRAYPNGQFFIIDHLREPVILGRDTNPNTSTTTSPFTLSAQSQFLALEALNKFQKILTSYKINKPQVHCVATAAVREAVNKGELLKCVSEKIGLEIDVLPGKEEARLVYLGMLQFFPIYEKLVLGVDIGGGSTEFVIGKQGKVVFGDSLKLGHVNLTQQFGDISHMREHIRLVIKESRLVDKIKNCGFEVVVGSSGTIKAIEKAVFEGYANMNNVHSLGDGKRDWKLSIGELKGVVKCLCGGEGEKIRRDEFFERRSEFIIAGAVLLEEIFGVLGIEEMEVSGYALAEGVIAESLAEVHDVYNLNVNARWSSILQLAMRFNGKKRMRAAAQCAVVAKEIFEGLRKCADNQFAAFLDDKDLEYLEAACLLHNIGNYIGKKGYHEQSHGIIMNCNGLCGYGTEEVKLIALLVRHHRNQLPNFDHALVKLSKEVEQKFRSLCAIIRLSVALQQHGFLDFLQTEFSCSCEGYRLKFSDQLCSHVEDQNSLPYTVKPLHEDIADELKQDLKYFKLVFHRELFIEAPSSANNL